MPERRAQRSRDPGSPSGRRPPRADGPPRPGPVAGYTTREVSRVLGISASTVLAWARSGLLHPSRDGRGAYVFSFQDIAVLRSAKALLEAEVPTRRVKQTLAALREQLAPGRPLSAVHLSALGGRVLVRDEHDVWEADTGQFEMGLAPPPRAEGDAKAPPAALASPRPAYGEAEVAEAAFDAALGLEATDPAGAVRAYRRALAADPDHADAHVNLGRLLHEEGDLGAAEGHYRAALHADPAHARARYNLGVALEDRGRSAEAAEAYREALELDPNLAVAHFNLSRLHEAAGRRAEAFQHLANYKRILDRGDALP